MSNQSRREFVKTMGLAAAAVIGQSAVPLQAAQAAAKSAHHDTPQAASLAKHSSKSHTKLYLHPKSLSPDPTYGQPAPATDALTTQMRTFPHHLVRVSPPTGRTAEWAAKLDLFRQPGPLVLTPDADGCVEIVLDFGTELDATPLMNLSVTDRCTIMAYFGESLAEAEGQVPGLYPRPEVMWHLPAAGTHERNYPARGFRFARFLFHDIRKSLTINRLEAFSDFTFPKRPGDFHCDDPHYQRAWQSSAYTVHLCTRPDTIWDGIKRDRAGWFGDARIIKQSADSIFFDPRPSRSMLPTLPVKEWANGVPVYSFDAIAMFKQHLLVFGVQDPCIKDTYEKIVQFLNWVRTTQTDEQGFIIRGEKLPYFADIGFLDWSEMPVGGRFEELSWLQCKHVEGLRTAAQIARWLGKPTDASAWEAQANKLQEKIIAAFWKPGVGFIHTLNHVGPVGNPHLPGYDGHYEKTYIKKIRLGPSGPSRQANAMAIWAGVASEQMRAVMLERVFRNPAINPIVTAYFNYFEQEARAQCGDPAGALQHMSGYISHMLETEDAATLWELYDPEVKDFRKYFSHFEVTWDYPLSLCHGWGSGLIPLTQRHLLGLAPQEPGYGALALEPTLAYPLAFTATIPTPHGPIQVTRDDRKAPFRYKIPKAIKITKSPKEGILIERT